MENLLSSITQILISSLAGEPPPPQILNGLEGKLNALLSVSADPSGDGINRWLSKLHDITHDSRLHETLLVRALQMHFPSAAELLTLVGIIKFEYSKDNPTIPIAFSIDWDAYNRILKKPGDEALNFLLLKVASVKDISALKVLLLLLFSSPQELLQLEYRNQGFCSLPLGQPGINSNELLDLIENLVHSPLSLPLPFKPPLAIDELKNIANTIGPQGTLIINGPDTPEQFDKLAGFSIEVELNNPALLKTLPIEDGWSLGFDSSDNTPKKFKIAFTKNDLDPSVLSEGHLGVFLTKTPMDKNALLIGEQSGTHFSIQTIAIGFEFNKLDPPKSVPIFNVQIKFGKIEFALKPDFLKFLSFGLNIPEQLLFQSDVALSYVQGKGLSGQGANGDFPALGIEFATPLNLTIGGSGANITIDNVITRLEATLKDSDIFFRVLFRYGAKAQFGPIKAILQGAGIWLGRWTDSNGGLLPPEGIGVSLDAGPVNGGGFLQFINDNEFAGVFQIKILSIGAFAYCIYKTLPSGDVSFVTLIGIRFPMPGIQISFGFAVTGFGGLVGINRKADTDLIRERLSTGTASEVLFNDDPMKNAPKLLGDMQQFFPDLKGGFIIGPTLQINWLYIVTLEVGLFIQLPGPIIFIAGTAKLVIGSEEFALVYLRMDFIGGIDTTKSLIFFDAALVNSNVLGIFRITGGVALRIAYGENGYFLFSVGGFHPSFNPGSFELPKVPRVGVSYSLGVVWLKNEMYLAITSNTFQLGYKIEAGLEIGPLSAHGWFAFDALIQFKPFYFIGQIDAGFDVEVEGVSLCNVHIEGLLSGPGPLVLQARASVKILFVRVSGDVTLELCSNPPESIINIPNIPQHFKDDGELTKAENLRSEGDDQSVIFAENSTSLKLFTPVGVVIWEQKRVPVQLPIQKLEGVELNGLHQLSITTNLPDTQIDPEYDWFGVGTYLKLPDSEALNNAQFVQQQSGIKIGNVPLVEGESKMADLSLSLLKLPARNSFLELQGSHYLSPALSGMLGERLTGGKLSGGKSQVTVAQEKWNCHSANGKITNNTSLNSIQAFMKAKQSGGTALPADEKQVNLSSIL